MLRVSCLFLLVLTGFGQGDPRALYDVRAYRLDLRVPEGDRAVVGMVGVEAVVVGESLHELHLDAGANLSIEQVIGLEKLPARGELAGMEIPFRHEDDRLICRLPKALGKGDTLRVAVRYESRPTPRGKLPGIVWRMEEGRPWIGTTCQGPGAHVWWPCKSSWFHPEDKHEQLTVNLTVPKGLYGVSNGRLVERTVGEDGETFHWHHPYPCETYAVTMNVGPYVVVESELRLPEIEEPVPFIYYVLPRNEEKARVQFAQVPQLLEIFTKAFGPYPFPKAKFGLVEAPLWGMEHSTAVAYGSSYPAWCKKTGATDRYQSRNRFFDYILVHEVAHEWWGNGVSASDWGHFWIHEGFGTYAEGVYVELRDGREAADRYFDSIRRGVGPRSRLFRGKGVTSRQAYSGTLYYKGAWVLNTLRHYVADDAAWWKTLRDFNLAWRYKNAGTEEFRAVLEKNTGTSWKQFFDEWFYGVGFPRLVGKVRRAKDRIVVDVENTARRGKFHVPLDLAWTERGQPKSERVMLTPGKNRHTVRCGARPKDLEIRNLRRVLGRHRVTVE